MCLCPNFIIIITHFLCPKIVLHLNRRSYKQENKKLPPEDKHWTYFYEGPFYQKIILIAEDPTNMQCDMRFLSRPKSS